MRRAVGLADVLDQRDIACFQRLHQFIRQPVKALHVRDENGAGFVVQLGDDLLVIHRQRVAVDIDEHGRKAVLQDGSDIGDPCQRRHDYFAALGVAHFQQHHAQQVRRRAGIDEDAVFHAQPLRPFFLERPHVDGLRKDRVVLFQVFDDGIEVVARDVVAH